MRKHLSKAFRLHPTFGEVGVVKDDTTGISLCISPAADQADELAVDGVDDAMPVDTSVIH